MPQYSFKNIKVYSSHKLTLVHILMHGPAAQINHANYSKFKSKNLMTSKRPQYFLNKKKQNIVGLLGNVVVSVFSYLKVMANESGSSLFLIRKAPSRGIRISMSSASPRLKLL